MARFILLEIRKEANMWHVHASNAAGSIEKVVSQQGAVGWVRSIYAPSSELPIQLLVYNENGRIHEAWAFKVGSARKLEICT